MRQEKWRFLINLHFFLHMCEKSSKLAAQICEDKKLIRRDGKGRKRICLYPDESGNVPSMSPVIPKIFAISLRTF